MDIGQLAEGGSLFIVCWVIVHLLTKIVPNQTKATDKLAKEIGQLKELFIQHHEIVKSKSDPHLYNQPNEDDDDD